MAVISSISIYFPFTTVNTCIFHYGQNIIKFLKKTEIFVLYKNNFEVNRIIRMFLNLVFVPIDCVVLEFKKILDYTEEMNLKNILLKFIEYLIKNYIGEFDDNLVILKAPFFKFSLWNANERVVKRVPRTTNVVEAWHKSLKSKIGVTHPNVGRFINTLQKEEEMVRINLIKSKEGILEYSRVKFEKEAKLFTVVKNYKNFENMGFFVALEKVIGWKDE